MTQTALIEPDTTDRYPVPVIVMASPQDLAESWDLREAMYSKALEYSWQPADTAQTVSNMLATGKAWALDVRLGDDILASCVVEKIATKEGPMLNIWVCTGTALDEWIDDMLNTIESWGDMMDCRGVQLSGRVGWHRVLSKYGYEPAAITLVKRQQP